MPEERHVFTTIHQSETNESVTDLSAAPAADKLRGGIVHLAIDQLEEAQQKGYSMTKEHINRLWEELIKLACEKDCGCAQTLRGHVSLLHLRLRSKELNASLKVWCDELKDFWATTTLPGPPEGQQLSSRQKKNLAKRAKAIAKVLIYDIESSRREWTDEH